LASNAELKETYSKLYEEERFDELNDMMLKEKANLEKFYSISLEKPMTAQQVEAYTTLGGTPHLDGEYTVFGQLIKGLDVLDRIASEPTGPRDVPEEKVYMMVSVELLPKSKIEKEFGYSYEK